MFKKLMLSFLIFFSFCFSVSANSFETTIDVNIRLKPYYNSLRIGHLKKGKKVYIMEKKWNWCKTSYKNYEEAYIYCPLLKESVISKSNKVEKREKMKNPLTLKEFALSCPKDWWFASFSTVPQMDFRSPIDQLREESIPVSGIMVARIDANSEKEAQDNINELLEEQYGEYQRLGKNIKKELISIKVGDKEVEIPMISATLYEGDKASILGKSYEMPGIQKIMIGVTKGKKGYFIDANTTPANEINNKELESIMKTFRVK